MLDQIDAVIGVRQTVIKMSNSFGKSGDIVKWVSC